MKYTAVLVPGEEPGMYVAYVPVLGVTTQGTSFEHALEMAKEASDIVVEMVAERDDEIFTEPAGTVTASIDVAVPAAVPA